MAAADSGGLPISAPADIQPGEGRVKERGESRPIRSTDGGNSRFLGRYIPWICRDSYEFPTDPAILSRPHRPIPSNRGERVAVGKSIMCGGYFTLGVEMEILCSCSFSSFFLLFVRSCFESIWKNLAIDK